MKSLIFSWLMCSKPIFCSKIARKSKTGSWLLERKKLLKTSNAAKNRDRPTCFSFIRERM